MTGPLISARAVGLIAFTCAALTVSAQTTAPNEWTQLVVSGATTNNSPYGALGVYGTLGKPAKGNIPGGRDSAATWTDKSGNFWLFGGEGPDANGNFGQLNDLWVFEPSTQEWTWMGGSSTIPAYCAGNSSVFCGQPGTYGKLGAAAAANIPGGRSVASYWTDANGSFWLFGGYGFDAGAANGDLNDLWEFSPATGKWTWMGGSSTIGGNGGQPGVYGTIDVAAAGNIPSARDTAATWTDGSDFWLYGGKGVDSEGNAGELDDLWMLDPTTNEWTWMSGNSAGPAVCEGSSFNEGLCGWPAVYGTLETPAPGIGPGSRVGALGWTDRGGNLWLFGGISNLYWEQRDFSLTDEYDLWKFDPSTKQWAWMSGNSTSLCGESSSNIGWCDWAGIYGTLGTPSIANIPWARDSADTWTDSAGNLWLFGGSGSFGPSLGAADILCNDVWTFVPSADEWGWMNGGQGCENSGTTDGVLGMPAAGNAPSSRSGGARWTDSSGNVWLFGGFGGYNSTPVQFDLNDLWVYQPSAPAAQPSFELLASPGRVNIAAIGPGSSATTTATTTVKIVTAADFHSPVTLSAGTTKSGPLQITGSFSPATVTGAGSSQLTISVAGAAGQIAEPFALTITGTGGGISESFSVIVVVTTVGQIAAPTISVPAGTYSAPQTVSMSDNYLISDQYIYYTTLISDQYIYYTTDGTTPTASSAVYVNPIAIAGATTLKAVAIDNFFNQSPLVSATYTFVAATPVIAPNPGTYYSPQSIAITDSTPGATIYYTTDGSIPTAGSALYSGPITVSSTETLKAIATLAGYGQSAVATSAFTIASPSFTISGSLISVAPGATAGNSSTVSLTPVGGFTGTINLSCAITPTAASDPATCSIPSSCTIASSAAETVTLTVNTTAATSALNHERGPFALVTGGAALAWTLLLGVAGRRRKQWGIFAMLTLLFLAAAGVPGCGGSGNAGGGGGGGGNAGTTPGTYVITVTGISGAMSETGTFPLTVQ